MDHILGRKLLKNVPADVQRDLARHDTVERLDKAGTGGSKLIYVRLPVTKERTQEWVQIRFRDYTYDQRDARARGLPVRRRERR